MYPLLVVPPGRNALTQMPAGLGPPVALTVPEMLVPPAIAALILGTEVVPVTAIKVPGGVCVPEVVSLYHCVA